MTRAIVKGKSAYSGGKVWKPGSPDMGLEKVFGPEVAKEITEKNPQAEASTKGAPPQSPVKGAEGERSRTEKPTGS